MPCTVCVLNHQRAECFWSLFMLHSFLHALRGFYCWNECMQHNRFAAVWSIQQARQVSVMTCRPAFCGTLLLEPCGSRQLLLVQDDPGHNLPAAYTGQLQLPAWNVIVFFACREVRSILQTSCPECVVCVATLCKHLHCIAVSKFTGLPPSGLPKCTIRYFHVEVHLCGSSCSRC